MSTGNGIRDASASTPATSPTGGSFGPPRLERAGGGRHTEAEHGDGARLGVAEWFEVNPVEGRGRKADPVAQEHREDIDQNLVDEPSLQALAGQVGAEDLQVLTARGA